MVRNTDGPVFIAFQCVRRLGTLPGTQTPPLTPAILPLVIHAIGDPRYSLQNLILPVLLTSPVQFRLPPMALSSFNFFIAFSGYSCSNIVEPFSANIAFSLSLPSHHYIILLCIYSFHLSNASFNSVATLSYVFVNCIPYFLSSWYGEVSHTPCTDFVS